MIRIKNWEKFQHYKKRKPSWIKLYPQLVEDVEWHSLSDQSARALINLWLIASEECGTLPSIKQLAFRLRMTEQTIIKIIETLSHWLVHDASDLLATRKQPASLETERETEGEKETEGSARANDLNNISAEGFKPPSIVPQRAAPAIKRARPIEHGIHVDFISQFGAIYMARTREPFHSTDKMLRTAKDLIAKHGLPMVVMKAQRLAEACDNQDKWFTKQNGWGEFTIETLETKWNLLIVKEQIDPKAKADAEFLADLKKLEEERERTHRATR